MGFFGSLTGSDQKKAIRKADKAARSDLEQGYNASQGYYDQAFDMLSPYAEQGEAANNFYYDALGLNGDDARSTAVGTLTSNPLFQGQLGQESNALLRNLNARGMGGGGTAAMAGQRVFQQTAGNWLDRYRDAGQQGFQATGTQAGIRTGQGDNAYGYGATKAGMQVNKGNALAAASTQGINNLIGLGGSLLNGFNAFRGR